MDRSLILIVGYARDDELVRPESSPMHSAERELHLGWASASSNSASARRSGTT